MSDGGLTVVISRTSYLPIGDDTPPIDGAKKVRYGGTAMNGNDIQGYDWIVTVDSLQELVDRADAEIIVSEYDTRTPRTSYDNVSPDYSAEIYDDYRE